MAPTTLNVRGRFAGAMLSGGALAALFFVTACASMVNFGVNTPIWFCNAFAICWLLQHRSRDWPILVACVWAADCAAIQLFGSGPAPVLAIADSAESLAAAALIRRIGGPAVALSSASGMFRLIAICTVVPVFSAAWAAAFLFLDGAPLLAAFVQWYGAASLALLIICPSLLIWLTPELRPALARAELRRVLLLGLALAFIAAIVFSLPSPEWLFILFPALLLLVWSSGLAGASIGSVMLLVVGLASTFVDAAAIHNLVNARSDPMNEIQALQLYLSTLALSSLPLAVVLTHQQRLTRELARVAEARSEFLAAMSHEIRTPMTGVLGMVDLLEAEPTTPAQRRYLDSIRSSGRHLLNIINDILDFSRIETGRIELENIEFSLPILLEQLGDVLNPLARERRISLHLEIAEGSPPVVKGDPTRIKQVLLNLTGNAIKFTPAGSVLVLVTYRAPATSGDAFRFRFEVRDTGIGIPADKQAELFAAFTQADHSTRRQFGGSGLGLAISKRLVTAMGGEIGVDSVEGEGSLFWFEVPLERGDAMRLPRPRSGEPEKVTPRRILLAEDVDLNRDIVRTVLAREGHEVALAENGQEAVELARAGTFDLVLMDVHMPLLDGLEATRLIRALPPPAGNVPIVALTANVMATEQAKCIRAGMNGVLMKPIEWDRVRAAIEQFCEPGRAEGRAESPAAKPWPAAPSRFDEATFGRLAAILPPVLLQSHYATLTAQVRELLDAKPRSGSAAIAAVAHKLASQAGMLGLMRLSAAAAEVEQAVVGGRPATQALGRFRTASGDIKLLAARLSARPAAKARRTS